jgi:hypothetical protein
VVACAPDGGVRMSWMKSTWKNSLLPACGKESGGRAAPSHFSGEMTAVLWAGGWGHVMYLQDSLNRIRLAF